MKNEIKLIAPPKGKYFRIPESNLSKLDYKIAELNKHAEKVGCIPVRLEISRKEEQKDADTGEVATFYHVYIEGEAPKLKGWTFLGALTHAPEGNITRLVPGKNVPESYRTSKPVCDYCHKDWIVRKDTYIVQNEKGEFKQVGGNCLADFLGHPDPFRYANYAGMLASLPEEIGSLEKDISNSPLYQREDLKIFLAEVAAVIDKEGWISGKQAYDTGKASTARRALDELDPHQSYDRFGKRIEKIRPEKKHFEEAEKVISYMRTDLKPENDYQHNLKTLTSVDNFLVKEGSGFVASALPYYRREIEKKVTEEQNKKKFANSTYIGEVGERLYEFRITVLGINETEGFRGTMYIVRMQDEKGNVYVWFGTGVAATMMVVGEDYIIDGTVKDHKEWKGRKETILTRVKATGV